MEDAPRNQREDEEILPRPIAESSDESYRYKNLWRRFGLGRLNTEDNKIEISSSDDDEDEDEDDEENAVRRQSTSERIPAKDSAENWAYSRFIRIRRKIKPLLPQLETVVNSEDIVQDTQLEATEPITSGNYQEDQAKLDAAVESTESTMQATDTINERTETTSSPEPESIEEILRRRNMNNEFIQRNTYSQDGQTEQLSQEKAIIKPASEQIMHKPTTTFDRYLEKKKQKKMINKITDKELHDIKEDQKKLRDELESKIIESEKQHIILKQSIEQEAKNAINREKPGVSSTKNNIKNEKIQSVTPLNKLEKPFVKISEQEYKQQLINESRNEIKRLSEFQNTIEHVESLKDTKITSEKAFERRHEVMDEPRKAMNTNFVPLAMNERIEMEKSLKRMQDEQKKHQRITMPRIVREIKDSPESKHAMKSGIFGAVVGVALFIIIYALS